MIEELFYDGYDTRRSIVDIRISAMDNEADAEAASSRAVDSDGSVSWEDFFGTSTDLVPQLLGMFDELARRGDDGCGDGCGERVVLPSSCSISTVLQKRLSLIPVAHRNSIFDQFCNSTDLVKSRNEGNLRNNGQNEHDEIMETINNTVLNTHVPAESLNVEHNTRSTEKEPSYQQQENSSFTSLRYNRRCRNGDRPLSGSSIASSTSSSSCSNQGNTCVVNPYLASVESLADTCASSQGSADSGVVTISEVSCRILNNDNNQRRNSAEEDSSFQRSSANSLRYCDPHRNSVERVLLEIVDTEAIYVEHLRQVIQGYLIFWRDNPTSFIHQLHLGDLFSNIEDIFEFNREFLKEIEKCGLDPVSVANTFIKHNLGFKVYTEYCTNYPRTVSILTDLMGQEETASAFRERQMALGHALPLGSYLLKPVQRILKYHLLLENLSKEYDADCDSSKNQVEGREAIEAALATMTGIAKHINAMKRRHEHAVRVQEIQSLLYGWLGPDLTTSGELVAEGRFRIRGAKVPRHAFLFDRMLLLAKQKEDGLLVYKTHIMCSNLMLIESIPGEPLSFHVIPFDNPRLQYTLQARNLEQKKEWTLQIKRVILENYNAVIPSHARQLVLQLGQTQQEDDVLADKGSAKKHSAPPEYLEKRKQERERRRSETNIRQRFKKNVRKSDTTIEEPAVSSHKNDDENGSKYSKEQTLTRFSDGRASKVKDRFTGWRRKSEPGFQSYVCLNHSDGTRNEEVTNVHSTITDTGTTIEQETTLNSSESKDNNEQSATPAQTVEEIVGHILMQNQEFQKLLEKQQTNSIINIRHQRFKKRISADTSDESDLENVNYIANSTNHGNNNRLARVRATQREQHLIRTNNARNSSLSIPARENQPLEPFYNNLKIAGKLTDLNPRSSKINHVHEKRAIFQPFKQQSIISESKVIKTALQLRDNAISSNEEILPSSTTRDINPRVELKNMISTCHSGTNDARDTDSKGFGNYDNLQHVWKDLQMEKDVDGNDSPTRPAVWLTKLCEGLPTSPPKSGSLPRSFQINPNPQPSVIKSRFLQRDGKPMSERPFTIASDKPAEINLEDMERYASACQPEGRIAKFPMPASSSSSSTFFCSLEDTLPDVYSDLHVSTASSNIHPDHKIYRANAGGSAIFKNVFSKTGNRLQSLRSTMSTETLECNGELERTKYFRSLDVSKSKRKTKSKYTKESVSDMEEMVSCMNGGVSNLRIPLLYYKQGSSRLGARIAQLDYADPTILFAESKRAQSFDVKNSKTSEVKKIDCEENDKDAKYRESETDSFYEKSFETIENYVDANVEEPFRDSAIFSDIDETFVVTQQSTTATTKMKIAPPIPAKRKQEMFSMPRCKPTIAQKPDHLKMRSVFVKRSHGLEEEVPVKLSVTSMTYQSQDDLQNDYNRNVEVDKDDVSVGQSQVGWVRRIVSQLQDHVET